MIDRDKLRSVGWAVAAIVTVLLGARLLGASGGDDGAGVPVDPLRSDVAAASSQGGATPGSAAAASAAGPELLVHVAGEVGRPGVYRVPPGSRVTDAVARAGGLTRR